MARKRRFSRAGGQMNPMKVIVPAMLYGAVRAPVSNALGGITKNIPLGGIGDEVALGLVSWFAAKNGKGMIKQIGMGGLIVESARIGEAISTGGLGLGGATAQGNGVTSGLVVV